MSEPTRVGRRGTIVLSAKLRRRYGLEEGTTVVAEEVEYGVLLRPAALLPVEIYSPERKAEFLIANAIDPEDRKASESSARKLRVKPPKTRSARRPKR